MQLYAKLFLLNRPYDLPITDDVYEVDHDDDDEDINEYDILGQTGESIEVESDDDDDDDDDGKVQYRYQTCFFYALTSAGPRGRC